MRTHNAIYCALIIGLYFVSVNKALATDSDGDGLSDYDEIMKYSTDPSDSDSDDDNMQDDDEVRAGTNPNDPNSFFAITNWSVEGFHISWPGYPNRIYQVYWSDSLTNSFEPIGSPIVGPQNFYSDNMHSTNDSGFYKVDVALLPISAIMAPNLIDVAANTLVTGPIMVLDNGELIIDDKVPPGGLEGDFDTIILGDNAFISPRSTANEGVDYSVIELPVPNSLPAMPDFSGYKATAEAIAPTLGLVTQNVLNVVGDMYFNYPDGLIIEKITGSGTIVNTGDLIIGDRKNALQDVSSDIAIISFEDVQVQQKTVFGNNILIYGYNTVYYGDACYCSSNSTLLADGGTFGTGLAEDTDDIIMGSLSEFMGLVFADEGNVEIQPGIGGNNTIIVGAVISGNDVNMNSNSEIIFDPTGFYDGALFSFTSVLETDLIDTQGEWEEVPPL